MIEPLEYNSGLSREQAREKYSEVRTEFEEVKKHYSNFLIWLKRKISDEDRKTLNDCVGILLPLSLESIVQEQPSFFQKITQLNFDIMKYLSRFKNTGVKMLGNSSVM